MENEKKTAVTNQEAYAPFRKWVIRWGRITLILSIIMSFFPALYLWAFEGIFPGWDVILKAFAPVALSWFLVWIIEPLSYFPILGLSGTYVTWLSGNTLNLRIPCSIIAQEAAGVEEGTSEGDIISTIGLCASVVVNLIAVFIFAIAGAQILQVLPASVNTAFNYVLPAITGALLLNFLFRNWKVGVIAIAMSFLVKLFSVSTAVEIAFVIFGTIIISVFLYKKKIIK